jgi:hypothetical protein
MAGRIDLWEHWANVSDFIAASYRLSGQYRHAGAKGDIREGLLQSEIQAMLPDTIRLQKAEICDSEGRRTHQFDMVMSHESSSAIRPFGPPAKRRHRVRTVPRRPVGRGDHAMPVKKMVLRCRRSLRFVSPFRTHDS